MDIVATPQESIHLGWFTVDRYARGKHSCMVRGTPVSLPPKAFTVLKILAGAQEGGTLVSYAHLQAAFAEQASATVLASQALGQIEATVARVLPGHKIIERQGHAGVRLLPAPAVPPPLAIASLLPAAATRPTAPTPVTPRPAPQKPAAPKPAAPVSAPVSAPATPPAPRPGRPRTLIPVVPKGHFIPVAAMVKNALYATPEGRWFVAAGMVKADSAEMQEGLSDGAAPATQRAAHIRLDESSGAPLPLEAESAMRVNAAYAWAVLKGAYDRIDMGMQMGAMLTQALPSYKDDLPRLVGHVNSGDPERLARALPTLTLALRAPDEDRHSSWVVKTPYAILHRRAINQMARLTAMAFDVPFDSAMRALANTLAPDARDVKARVQLFPYKKLMAVDAPVYKAARHGRAAPVTTLELGWCTLAIPASGGQAVITESRAAVRPEAARLAQYLAEHYGRFVTRAAIHKALYPKHKDPEASLNYTLSGLRLALTPVARNHRKHVNDILLMRRGMGLRLMRPGETWAPPAKVKVKAVREPKVKPEKVKPAPQTRTHDFGHFQITETLGVKLMSLRITGRNRYLSRSEFALLQLLNAQAGTWVTRSSIGAALFPNGKNADTRTHATLTELSQKLRDALGAPVAAEGLHVQRGAGVCLLHPGMALPETPELPAANAKAVFAAAAGTPETLGPIALIVRADAKHQPALFTGTEIFLSPSELSLLRHLWAHKNTWVSTARIRTMFFSDAVNAHSRAFTLIQSLSTKMADALGPEKFAQVFDRVPRAGLCLSDGTTPRPPLPAVISHKRAAQGAAPAAGMPEAPALYYHPAYGPGYDLGVTTREIQGSEVSFNRFMPVTLKEPREQVEVMLAKNRAGYGRLNMDAYRAALQAGVRELRHSLESQRYDGPPPAALAQAMAQNRSPAHVVPLLAAFTFYLPGAKDGSAQIRAQLTKSVARSIVLAYPETGVAQAQKFLELLQTIPTRLQDELIWPFDNSTGVAGALARLDVAAKPAPSFTKGHKPKGHGQAIGDFVTAAVGTKVAFNATNASRNGSFDVAAYLAARRPASSLIIG